MSGPTPPVTLQDRLLKAFRALVREEFPRITFLGTYEYVVQSSTTTTAAVSPTDTGIGLPGLVNVPMSFPSATATLATGSKVLLTFINGDPARPVITSVDTTVLYNIAGGGPPIARLGDTVQAGPYTGTITSGSSKSTSG